MTMQTYHETQPLAILLEQALRDGSVRILRSDGTVFLPQSEKPMASPLDIPGIEINLTTDEIVAFVHEGRRQD